MGDLATDAGALDERDSRDEALAALVTEVEGLKDLFRRRLMEDKTKSLAFERLYEQLEYSREGLQKQVLQPLIMELILVIDRLDSAAGDDPFRDSIRSELQEILARRLVAPLSPSREFDPSQHEAVGVKESVDHPPGSVLAQVRVGWRYGDTLLRASQVIVSR